MKNNLQDKRIEFNTQIINKEEEIKEQDNKIDELSRKIKEKKNKL